MINSNKNLQIGAFGSHFPETVFCGKVKVYDCNIVSLLESDLFLVYVF